MSLLFIVWLSLLPFISFGGAFEGPKIIWLWGGGFVLALFWIYRLSRNAPVLLSLPDTIFLIWIVLLTVSSVTGIHPIQSILGGSYRHQGIMFFITIYLISITLPILPKRATILLRKLFILSIIVESCVVLYQKNVLYVSRPIGTVGEPNAVAGFLAVGLYFLLSEKQMSLLLRSCVTLLIMIGIQATGSRTGIAVAGIVLCGYVWSFLVSRKLSAATVGLLLGSMVSIVTAGYVYTRVITITRPVSTYENRTEFWSVGFEEFVKRPMFGYGAESLEVVYDQAYARVSMPLVEFMIDRSHNLFLDVALWSGSIGLVFFVIWLGLLVKSSVISRDTPQLFALVGWIVFASVQPVGVVQWIILLMLGMGVPLHNHAPYTAKTGE